MITSIKPLSHINLGQCLQSPFVTELGQTEGDIRLTSGPVEILIV